MRKRGYLIILHVLFYGMMVYLTLSTRELHNASLPVVIAEYPELQSFGEGDAVTYSIGIPKELYNGGSIYRISLEKVNGEERSIARCVTDLTVGRENAGYYEVLDGLSGLERIIISGQNDVTDGSEVLIQDEKK